MRYSPNGDDYGRKLRINNATWSCPSNGPSTSARNALLSPPACSAESKSGCRSATATSNWMHNWSTAISPISVRPGCRYNLTTASRDSVAGRTGKCVPFVRDAVSATESSPASGSGESAASHSRRTTAHCSTETDRAGGQLVGAATTFVGTGSSFWRNRVRRRRSSNIHRARRSYHEPRTAETRSIGRKSSPRTEIPTRRSTTDAPHTQRGSADAPQRAVSFCSESGHGQGFWLDREVADSP